MNTFVCFPVLSLAYSVCAPFPPFADLPACKSVQLWPGKKGRVPSLLKALAHLTGDKEVCWVMLRDVNYVSGFRREIQLRTKQSIVGRKRPDRRQRFREDRREKRAAARSTWKSLCVAVMEVAKCSPLDTIRWRLLLLAGHCYNDSCRLLGFGHELNHPSNTTGSRRAPEWRSAAGMRSSRALVRGGGSALSCDKLKCLGKQARRGAFLFEAAFKRVLIISTSTFRIFLSSLPAKIYCQTAMSLWLLKAEAYGLQ